MRVLCASERQGTRSFVALCDRQATGILHRASQVLGGRRGAASSRVSL